MYQVNIKMTVYFDEPFWLGVCERTTEGKLEVSRVVFGAEPKDYEIYDYCLVNWNELYFSTPIATSSVKERKVNPKRMQRAIKKQVEDTGVGTKAQQALKLQQEQNKAARKTYNKQKKEEDNERKFQLKQEKRKAKHKGR